MKMINMKVKNKVIMNMKVNIRYENYEYEVRIGYENGEYELRIRYDDDDYEDENEV